MDTPTKLTSLTKQNNSNVLQESRRLELIKYCVNAINNPPLVMPSQGNLCTLQVFGIK